MSVVTEPRVSVLIPMRNAEPFIVKTIVSILQEKDVPIEVVVINDKSTDRSLTQVLSIRDERIRIVDGPGAGISACMNVGLSISKGDILMRCDADDQYPAGRIKEQLAWLDSSPEYAAVCGGFSTMDMAGRLVARMATGNKAEDISAELNSGKTRTSLCTYALRRSALQLVGEFRQYFESAEDIDFQLRLGEHAKVMYLPHSFYLYLLHDASMTHTQGSNKRMFFDETARKFQAQRKATGQDDLQRGCPPNPPEIKSDNPGSAAHQIQGLLTSVAWSEHAAGNKFKALRLGGRALMHSPLDRGMWRCVLALLLKPVKKIR